MKAIISALLVCINFAGFAQQCGLVLHGHVEDPDTREKLGGATVLIVELNKEIVTDAKGDFEFINVCAGNYTLRISHVDCKTVEEKISLTKNKHVDIDMPHEKNTLAEVTVSGIKGPKNTGSKKELTARDLEQTKGQSLAEALSRLNGVTMLQTGSTVAK